MVLHHIVDPNNMVYQMVDITMIHMDTHMDSNMDTTITNQIQTQTHENKTDKTDYPDHK